MYKYSKSSLNKLKTCHDDLQEIFKDAIRIYDITVISGHRGKKGQNELYKEGFSRVKFPDSKHNRVPSRAIDAAPYPVNWKDRVSLGN